jgi:hypothetical protein
MKSISAKLLTLMADADRYEVRIGDIKNTYIYASTAKKL